MICTFMPCFSCFPEQKGQSAAIRSIGSNVPSRITNALVEAVQPAGRRSEASAARTAPAATASSAEHFAKNPLQAAASRQVGNDNDERRIRVPAQTCLAPGRGWRPPGIHRSRGRRWWTAP